MKRHLLFVLAFALLAIPGASPFFWPGVPRTNDLAPHLFRTFFFDRALDWSGWWPRWSPDLVFGHGYPVFNFFPSLFHAAANLWHQLGLPLLTAFRVVTFLHFWLAALGSYLLGRTLLRSPAAGWAAALVYTYSPYLLYDVHVRGAGPETQALALLPLLVLALWQAGEQRTLNGEPSPDSDGRRPMAEGRLPALLSLRQVLISSLRSPWWVLATAVLFALTFLSHPVVYQILIPIGLWLLLRARFAARGGRFWVPLVGPLLGIAIGGLLVAFFWLPAYVEVGSIRAELSISQGYDYQSNFLTLADMLRWPQIPADPALVNPPVVRALPVVGLLWAAIGLLWRGRRLQRSERQIAIGWAAVLLLCIWLASQSSLFVWDNFPLLHLTCYPWRMLGMASLATSVLAALATKSIGDWRSDIGQPNDLGFSRPNLWLSLLLTVLVISASIPWLFPPRHSVAEDVDLALALDDETPPFLIGTTTLGEFLPRWVTELPAQEPAKSTLIAQDNPDRLQAADGLTWMRRQENPLDAHYTIHAAHPLTLTYGQFYFPGWRATLNGANVAINPSQPHGLITLAVPAGEHELRLKFGHTPARMAGELISAAALVGAIIMAFTGMRRAKRRTTHGVRPPAAARYPLCFFGLTAVLLWLFFALVDTPLRRDTLQPDGVLGRPEIEPLDYAGELRLLTFEQSATAISAAERVGLTLYWQPQREIGAPYLVGVQVRDSQGQQWQASVDRPSDWRFIGPEPWPLNSYRLEPFEITLADGTPPGVYRFHVGLVRADTGQTVAAHDLGSLQVTRPARGERALEAGMVAVGADTAVDGNLRLLGTRIDRQDAAPGGIARVTALWQVTQATAVTNTFTLHLLGADSVALSQPVTLAPEFPLSQWRPGDRLRSETIVRLTADVPSGAYEWQIRWGDREMSVGSLRVAALERSFAPPTVGMALEQGFGDVATLIGANLIPPPPLDRTSRSLDCTLVWHAERETATGYHVFVHLIDVDGRILAQSDGEPAEWTRPTTSWLAGEIIVDQHRLALPVETDNSLWLRVGLYDPNSGQRLPAANGDFVLIAVRP